MLTQINAGVKQLAERFADTPPPVHHEHVYYAYDPSSHDHASSKHHHGGGHKNNAAMSALTLLAFLFFLHILQQCIKDHMNSMANPPVMFMTTGREGEQLLKSQKLDKMTATENNRQNIGASDVSVVSEASESQLTRVTTAVHIPHKDGIIKSHAENKHHGFVNAMTDDY